MTVGTYNILTSLLILPILSTFGLVTCLIITRAIDSELNIYWKIFLVLISLIIVGIEIFLILKFRILIIHKEKIISIKPFIFQIKKIYFRNIKKVKWKAKFWDSYMSYFKYVEIEDNQKLKIAINDFEFENFEQIITSIKPIIKTEQSNKIYLEQAKENISVTNSYLILAILFVVFISILVPPQNRVHLFHIIIYSISFLVIFALFKRRKDYLKIIKNKNNILNVISEKNLEYVMDSEIRNLISEKNLEYVKGFDTGNFWGGVDTHNGMKWELFFEADRNGPTPKQLSQYKSFLTDFNTICENIKEHIAPQLPISVKNSFSNYINLPMDIHFVTLKKRVTKADVELVCCFYQKIFIFKKRLLFLVNIKNNQIVSVAPN